MPVKIGPSRTPVIDTLFLDEQSSNPSTGVQQGGLFTKDNGGLTDLYYRYDNDGPIVQLTANGAVPSVDWTDTGVFLYPAGGDTRNVVIGAHAMVASEKLRVFGDTLLQGRFAVGLSATIGIFGSYGKLWDFEDTITDFSGASNWEGLRCIITLNPTVDLTGGNAKSIYGSEFTTAIKAGNSKNFDFLQGPYMSSLNQGLGDINALYGPWLIAENDGTGTTTTQIGGVSVSYLGRAGVIIQNQGHVFQTGVSNAGGSISHDTTVEIASPFAIGTLADHVGFQIDDQQFGTNSFSSKQFGFAPNFFEAYTKMGGFAAQAPTINFGGVIPDKINFEIGSSANPNLGTTMALSNENFTNIFDDLPSHGIPVTYFGLFNEGQPGLGGWYQEFWTTGDVIGYAVNIHIGTVGPVTSALSYQVGKSDGAGGDAALSDTDTALTIRNHGNSIFGILGDGTIDIYGPIQNAIPSTPIFINDDLKIKDRLITTPSTVASASSVDLASYIVSITGNTQIDNFTNALGATDGVSGIIRLTGTPLIKNNSSGTGNIRTPSGLDITGSVGMELGFDFDGTICRLNFRYVS